jgi:hypothetical protein
MTDDDAKQVKPELQRCSCRIPLLLANITKIAALDQVLTEMDDHDVT